MSGFFAALVFVLITCMLYLEGEVSMAFLIGTGIGGTIGVMISEIIGE